MVTNVFVALLGLVASAAQGDSSLAQIQKMLSRQSVMCGEFEQKKTLVGLQRPVKSSGRFCVVTDKGVLWNTQKPFASTLRLTREEIVQSDGGRVTARLSARDEPTVSVISELLFSVLAGDFERLRSQFTINASVAAPTWRAQLVPKESGLRRVIKSIELGGSDFVREITMVEASGDRTAISFNGMATGPTALLPEEARAFEASAGRGGSGR